MEKDNTFQVWEGIGGFDTFVKGLSYTECMYVVTWLWEWNWRWRRWGGDAREVGRFVVDFWKEIRGEVYHWEEVEGGGVWVGVGEKYFAFLWEGGIRSANVWNYHSRCVQELGFWVEEASSHLRSYLENFSLPHPEPLREVEDTETLRAKLRKMQPSKVSLLTASRVLEICRNAGAQIRQRDYGYEVEWKGEVIYVLVIGRLRLYPMFL